MVPPFVFVILGLNNGKKRENEREVKISEFLKANESNIRIKDFENSTVDNPIFYNIKLVPYYEGKGLWINKTRYY